jgi:ABC-type Fe3+-hydroxamate transport system substrate-binding protein
VVDRIVSLVPSHTESLHDLGLAEKIVGRTRFCIHPSPWVDSVPIVGGTKDARSQKILDLRPDLVVADKDENPKALVEALQAAGVDVLWSAIDTVEDAARFLEVLGERAGAPDAGRTWATRIRLGATPPSADAVPVFCPIWHGPWMTFNRSSYCDAMLAASGMRNVFGDRPGAKYFEVHEGDAELARAAWTLLPSEPFPFHAQRAKVDTSGLGACGRPERVRLIDGEALTWFGTRTVAGLEELRATAQALR